MAKDGLELHSLGGLDSEAGPHQIPALLRHVLPEADLGVADVLVLLEGDVAADHVEEEDAQGPDGQRVAVVAAAANPFWRRVHSGACNKNIEIHSISLDLITTHSI